RRIDAAVARRAEFLPSTHPEKFMQSTNQTPPLVSDCAAERNFPTQLVLRRARLGLLIGALALSGCSGSEGVPSSESGGSLGEPAGGKTSSGGAVTSGGSVSTGGASAGGVLSNGGSTGSPGQTDTLATGGATASGGTPNGGSTAQGGGSQGGTHSGGTAPGGAGGSSTGGTANGGSGAGGTSGGTTNVGGTGGGGGTSNCTVTPIDPKATQATKNLLCYLYSIYTKSVLSGQQEQSWDPDRNALFTYTNQQTGKYPAVWGGDFLYEGSATYAKPYAAANGIIMMRYHMGAPPNADTYENSKLTVTNYDNLTVAGTAENTSLNSKLDRMATQLKDMGMPIILVPYHEVDQFAWFWWSKGTGPQFQKLWKYTVDYINNVKDVHNVIWTLGFGHDGALAAYYPGKEYVDLGGIDQYDKGTQPFLTQWNSVKSVFGNTMPLPLHETGTLPQPADMWAKGATWLLWNVWCNYLNTAAEGYTWNTPETIKSAYADSHTITRDELPTNLK
ncbi:MAG TPA: glycosyl hydrolase, partial [Polyangiaceae bacterium]|nr:glycosyl hydrolase [Polyangiaceae bacterium]